MSCPEGYVERGVGICESTGDKLPSWVWVAVIVAVIVLIMFAVWMSRRQGD